MILIFIVGAVISAVTLRTEFMPASDNNSIAMTVEMPTGTRMEVAREVGQGIAQRLREKYPEIEIVSFSVGRPVRTTLGQLCRTMLPTS